MSLSNIVTHFILVYYIYINDLNVKLITLRNSCKINYMHVYVNHFMYADGTILMALSYTLWYKFIDERLVTSL